MIEYSGKTIRFCNQAVTGKLCCAGNIAAKINCAAIVIWNGSCEIDEDIMYTAVALLIPSFIEQEKLNYAKKIADFYRIPVMKINTDVFKPLIDTAEKIAILDPQAQKLFINPNLETINRYFSKGAVNKSPAPTVLISCPQSAYRTPKECDGIVISLTPSHNESHLYDELCSIADANTGKRMVVDIALEDDDKFITSVRALYRASVWGRFSLLCSNISTPQKEKSCISLMHSAFRGLDSEEREFNGFIPKGIKIDTPLMLLSKPCHRLADFFCLDCPTLIRRFANSNTDDSWEYIAPYIISFAKNTGSAKITLRIDRPLPKTFAENIYIENPTLEIYAPKALASTVF